MVCIPLPGSRLMLMMPMLDCARQYRTPLLSLDKKMIALADQLQISTLEVSS